MPLQFKSDIRVSKVFFRFKGSDNCHETEFKGSYLKSNPKAEAEELAFNLAPFCNYIEIDHSHRLQVDTKRSL